MSDRNYYDPEGVPLDVGTWGPADYIEHGTDVADRFVTFPTTIVELQPDNGTRYHLALAQFGNALAAHGRADALSVVWIDTGKGHVFDLAPHSPLHEDYVAGKLGMGLADAWVVSRFLTALRDAWHEVV